MPIAIDARYKLGGNCKEILIFSAIYFSSFNLLSSLKSYMIDPNGFWYFITLLFINVCSITSIIIISYHKNNCGKIIWAIITSISTLVYNYFYVIYGYTIDIENIAFFIAEKKSLISLGVCDYLLNISILPIMIATALLFGILMPSPRRVFTNKYWLLTPIIPVILVCANLEYNVSRGGGMPAAFWTSAITIAAMTSAAPTVIGQRLTISPTATTKVKNIIVIVDESIRADFAPSRIISPYLQQLDSIYNYGWATASNNTSAGSNLVLRYGLDFNHLNNIKKINMPSIWQYAQNARFSTTYINCQTDQGVMNYMTAKELQHVDNHIYCPKSKPYNKDLLAAKIIKKVLTKKGKQFIYINKYGAHIPYHITYNNTIFSPRINAKLKEKAYNNYANAVAWSTDNFFKELLKSINLNETIIVYTSDHGQNLVDDGIAISHTRRENANWQEALVPFFMITKAKDIISKIQAQQQNNQNKVHHRNIFASILELMGYQQQSLDTKYPDNIFTKLTINNSFLPGPLINIWQQKVAMVATPWPKYYPRATFSCIDNHIIPRT